MRVAIVGCGVEGATLAGFLAGASEVTGLILVSRDGRRARALEEQLDALPGSAATVTRAADATDLSALEDAVVDADIVVNAALPEVNVPVLKSAISAGAHYLDMVAYAYETPDTPREATYDACADFDAELRERDLLAVPNTGASPGLTDLAAAYLAEGMDSVREATVRWGDRSDARDLIPPFTPAQVFSVSMPTPTAYHDGEVGEVDLVGESEVFGWPPPIGPLLMLTAAHMPEVRTLQAVVPAAKRIEVKTGLAIGRWDDWYKIWAEGLRRVIADPELAGMSLLDALSHGFGSAADYAEAVRSGLISEHGFGIAVSLRGDLDGRPVSRTITVMTTLAEATRQLPLANAMSHLTAGSTPLEIIRALGRDELSDRGVVPSVGALKERNLLIRRLASREFTVRQELHTEDDLVSADGWAEAPVT
jgi:hypothetical protein